MKKVVSFEDYQKYRLQVEASFRLTNSPNNMFSKTNIKKSELILQLSYEEWINWINGELELESYFREKKINKILNYGT
jgi:hypothetical protein